MKLASNPALLEFIGIDDDRQTEICHDRSVPPVILPANDPWWQNNWPPLHFRCRSTVRAIYAEEVKIRGIKPMENPRSEPPPMSGFGGNPLDTESFWRLTPGMIERAKKFGITTEIQQLAQRLGIKSKRFKMILTSESVKSIKDAEKTLNNLKDRFAAQPNIVTINQQITINPEDMPYRGYANYDTGEIKLAPSVFNNIQKVLRQGTINTFEEAKDFRTLVHEFGHLLGRPINSFLYENILSYRRLIQSVDDLWAIRNLKKTATEFGLKWEVRGAVTRFASAAYEKYNNRILEALRTAGMKNKKIYEFIEDLNLTKSTEQYDYLLSHKVAELIDYDEDDVAFSHQSLGEAVASQDISGPNSFPEYIENIKKWKRRRK